ncbi:hypothetical protein JCM9279_002110 [Rhodotorula babjevae]
MPPFPLQRKRSVSLGSTLSPSSDSPQPLSRTQRALSRLSRLRLPSMRAEPAVGLRTPASVVPLDLRPLKHARRQSRSFSTFFSSPLAPSPVPTTSLAANSALSSPSSSSIKRLALKRTNSFPALIEYPKSPAASIFPDKVDRDSWGAPRDVTLRLEKANLDSTFTPASPASIPFPRSVASSPYIVQTPRSFRLDDDDLTVYDTPPEVSRFSSSTEDHSADTTTTMSVSSCASSSIVAPLSHCAVLDVFTAPRDSVGEPLDLDFELEKGIPRSPPSSPQVYRHQPVVSHVGAQLGGGGGGDDGEDVLMASPTPAPRGPSARKWAYSFSTSSSRDVMDPAMVGFSYAATPAVVLGVDALLSSKSRPTPPPTPRIMPVGADTPSPFLLPRPAGVASPSLSSLILEDLTTELEKFAPVELPYDLPSTPTSTASLSSIRGRPVPAFAPSPPSTPRPAADPDTPTPVVFPPLFPFHCPSPSPGYMRKPSRTQLAPLSISPTPPPRAHCPSTASISTSASTYSLSPSLTSTSSLSLFSPFTFGSTSASASGSTSDMGSFPSPPTSPASSTAYYPRGAGRQRPKVLPPSPESVVMVDSASSRRA